MQKCYNVSVTGKVQDIGFRYVVEYVGRLFDLSGLVFNAKDGSVKIICRGEDGKISELGRKLDKGNDLLMDIKSDTSALPEIKTGIHDLNKKFDSYAMRLEKILEKLVESHQESNQKR